MSSLCNESLYCCLSFFAAKAKMNKKIKNKCQVDWSTSRKQLEQLGIAVGFGSCAFVIGAI